MGSDKNAAPLPFLPGRRHGSVFIDGCPNHGVLKFLVLLLGKLNMEVVNIDPGSFSKMGIDPWLP